MNVAPEHVSDSNGQAVSDDEEWYWQAFDDDDYDPLSQNPYLPSIFPHFSTPL